MKNANLFMIILPIVASPIIFFGIFFPWGFIFNRPHVPTAEEIPDNILVDQVKDFVEVQAFLARYPDAHTGIDRSFDLSVGYWIARSEVTGEQWNNSDFPEPGAGLVIWMNNDLSIEAIWFRCVYDSNGEPVNGFTIDRKIVKYIKDETYHCWDDPSPPRSQVSSGPAGD